MKITENSIKSLLNTLVVDIDVRVELLPSITVDFSEDTILNYEHHLLTRKLKTFPHSGDNLNHHERLPCQPNTRGLQMAIFQLVHPIDGRSRLVWRFVCPCSHS